MSENLSAIAAHAATISQLKPIPELLPADPDEAHLYKLGFSDALRAAIRVIGEGECPKS